LVLGFVLQCQAEAAETAAFSRDAIADHQALPLYEQAAVHDFLRAARRQALRRYRVGAIAPTHGRFALRTERFFVESHGLLGLTVEKQIGFNFHGVSPWVDEGSRSST